VFSLIIVTKTNAKGCVRGSWKKFYRRGHQRIFPGGAKSGEICFFPLETKKTTFFVQIF